VSSSDSTRDLATIAAELAVMAEGTARYQERVAELRSGNLGEQHDDLVAAIHEAERALRTAQRALMRANRIAG
jgi:C4-dicarboxylate-specific signal transduction histidine kinase